MPAIALDCAGGNTNPAKSRVRNNSSAGHRIRGFSRQGKLTLNALRVFFGLRWRPTATASGLVLVRARAAPGAGPGVQVPGSRAAGARDDDCGCWPRSRCSPPRACTSPRAAAARELRRPERPPTPAIRARTLATRSLTARSAGAPHVAVTAPTAVSANWTAVARVYGQPAAWIEQRSGVAFMRFDQSRVHLTLHAGSSDGGPGGLTYGDQITAREIHLLLFAFNGEFKLTYPDVGSMSAGHVAVALKAGLAPIVTYTDGTSNIGAWHDGVPSARKTVFSVLQNQHLLVDPSIRAANVATCVWPPGG